jgi:hypothetical protein
MMMMMTPATAVNRKKPNIQIRRDLLKALQVILSGKFPAKKKRFSVAHRVPRHSVSAFLLAGPNLPAVVACPVAVPVVPSLPVVAYPVIEAVVVAAAVVGSSLLAVVQEVAFPIRFAALFAVVPSLLVENLHVTAHRNCRRIWHRDHSQHRS